MDQKIRIEEDGARIHVQCGGVLQKEWTGADEYNWRCSYCKKVVKTEKANNLLSCTECGTKHKILVDGVHCVGCYNKKHAYHKDKKFWKWFDKNMIYCEDSHSFVHRLFKRFKTMPEEATYHDAQNAAFDIIPQMHAEYMKKQSEEKKKS